MTDDLIAFLRRMLDEDQRIAESTRQASPSWQNFDMDGELRDDVNAGTVCSVGHADRDHIARHDPARVLREVTAKRRILDGIVSPFDLTPQMTAVLRNLAAVYADRDGYREEWAPEPQLEWPLDD